MYLFMFCFLVEQLVLFIRWKIKIKMAVLYMFKENALDSIYAFIFLQYRRPRTAMEMANYFVLRNNFDQPSRKMFLKEVYKIKVVEYCIMYIILGFYIACLSFAVILGIKDGDSFCTVVGIIFDLFMLSVSIAVIKHRGIKKMKLELQKYLKKPF